MFLNLSPDIIPVLVGFCFSFSVCYVVFCVPSIVSFWIFDGKFCHVVVQLYRLTSLNVPLIFFSSFKYNIVNRTNSRCFSFFTVRTNETVEISLNCVLKILNHLLSLKGKPNASTICNIVRCHHWRTTNRFVCYWWIQ